MTGDQGQEVLSDDLTRQLDQLVHNEQVKERLPTLIAALVRDGTLLWCGAWGTTGLEDRSPPTSDTQFRIGSISKTFVAVSVMRLHDEGAVDLADPVGRHVSELSALPITLAQLLSHTSGLRAETPGGWWERTPGVSFDDLAASSLRPKDLLWRPGRRFHYSNVGYAVLGELVARKRSTPFADVLRDELWVPLGMERTSVRPVAPFAQGLAVHPHADLVLDEPEHDAVTMAPAGQFWSTIGDMARWSEVLAGRHPEILEDQSLAEMTEPLGVVDLVGHPWTSAYGLGLQLTNQGGRRSYGHTGGMPGFWSMLLVDQPSHDVALGFANSTYSGFRPAFFDDLLAVLSSRQPRREARFRPVSSADDRGLELTGVWYWGPVEHHLALEADGILELRAANPGRNCRLRPSPDGSYVGEGGYLSGERLEIHRRSDGSISHLDIASFVFTRGPYEPGSVIPGGVDRGWRNDGHP